MNKNVFFIVLNLIIVSPLIIAEQAAASACGSLQHLKRIDPECRKEYKRIQIDRKLNEQGRPIWIKYERRNSCDNVIGYVEESIEYIREGKKHLIKKNSKLFDEDYNYTGEGGQPWPECDSNEANLEPRKMEILHSLFSNVTLDRDPIQYLKDLLYSQGIKYSEGILERIADSVVLIVQTDGFGVREYVCDPIVGVGSGFFIDRNLIVTNNHVVANQNSRVFIINIRQKIIEIDKDKIIRIPGEDIALIPTKTEIENHLQLAKNDIKPGDKVFSIGFGSEMMNHIHNQEERKAFVTASRGEFIQETKVKVDKDLPLDDSMLLTIDISPGDSGSPILNTDGNVAGILYLGIGSSIVQLFLLGNTGEGGAETRRNIEDALKNHAGMPISYGEEVQRLDFYGSIIALSQVKEKFQNMKVSFFFLFPTINNFSKTTEKLGKLLSTNSQELFSNLSNIFITDITTFCNEDMCFLNSEDSVENWEEVLKKR